MLNNIRNKGNAIVLTNLCACVMNHLEASVLRSLL